MAVARVIGAALGGAPVAADEGALESGAGADHVDVAGCGLDVLRPVGGGLDAGPRASSAADAAVARELVEGSRRAAAGHAEGESEGADTDGDGTDGGGTEAGGLGVAALGADEAAVGAEAAGRAPGTSLGALGGAGKAGRGRSWDRMVGGPAS